MRRDPARIALLVLPALWLPQGLVWTPQYDESARRAARITNEWLRASFDVLDASQAWSSAVHNFKTAFYEAVLRQMIDVGTVTSADTGGGTRDEQIARFQKIDWDAWVTNLGGSDRTLTALKRDLSVMQVPTSCMVRIDSADSTGSKNGMP